MHTILVYQTNKSVWRANNPHWANLDYVTKRSIVRCVLLDIQDETINWLVELSLTNKEWLAEVLSDTLNNNKWTMVMN